MTADPAPIRTVLITGSSSGIGHSTARYFQERGWNVAATVRTPEKGEDLAVLDRVRVLELDVTKPETIEGAIWQAVDAFGGLDVVVNNAGYETMGPLEAATPEQISRQFDTNLFGAINVIRAALPQLREQRRGVIVNVSSVGGLVALPFASLYHGTKFALEGFSESLYYELEPLGIRVALIEPGVVDTPFNDENREYLMDPDLVDYQPTIEAMISSFSEGDEAIRLSTPEAIAGVIYTAATDEGPQLRYLAGDDAAELTELRRRGFDGFRDMVRKKFLGYEG